MKILLPVILFFVGSCCAQRYNCPSNISPCSCTSGGGGPCKIRCNAMKSQDAMDKMASLKNLCGGNAHIILSNSQIQELPARLWKMLFASKSVNVLIVNSGIQLLHGSILNMHSRAGGILKMHNSKVNKWNWEPTSKNPRGGDLTVELINSKVNMIESISSKKAGVQADYQLQSLHLK